MMDLVDQFNNNQSHSKSLEEFWREHIQLLRSSGLSGVAYCKQHGLKCHQLYYWVSRLNEQNETQVPFIAVKLNPHPVIPQSLITLCSLEFNGYQLKIHDPVVLPQLISLLSK